MEPQAGSAEWVRLGSPDLPPQLSADEDPVLADLVEELTARLQAGGVLDCEALLREHPAHAEQLRELLPALQALAQAGGSENGASEALSFPVRAARIEDD